MIKPTAQPAMSRSAKPSIDSLEFIDCELYRAELREENSIIRSATYRFNEGISEEKLRIKLWIYAAVKSSTLKDIDNRPVLR
jgi:hypothetical protein